MDVITLGETMYLATPFYGKLDSSSLLSVQIGGAESNVAIGLARLGHSVGWISRIGDDPFGQCILKTLRGEGVDVSRVQIDSSHRTGVYFKEILSNGRFNIYYYRDNSAASLMTPDILDEDYFKDAHYLYISGITPALSDGCAKTIEAAIQMAKHEKTKVVFDPNVRLKLWQPEHAKKTLLGLLPHVNYFLPGLEECQLLIEQSNPSHAAAVFQSLGAKAVIIKLGEDGAYYNDGQQEGFVPSVRVSKIEDPVGAGDGFTAGFISGLLSGLDLAHAVARGCAVGASVVAVKGDIEGLPTMRELEVLQGVSKVIGR